MTDSTKSNIDANEQLAASYRQAANQLLKRLNDEYGESDQPESSLGPIATIGTGGTDYANIDTENGVISGRFQIGQSYGQEPTLAESDAWIEYEDSDGRQIRIENSHLMGDIRDCRVVQMKTEELPEALGEDVAEEIEKDMYPGEFLLTYHDIDTDQVLLYRGDLREGVQAHWREIRELLG